MSEKRPARYPTVDPQPRFPAIERRVLAYWEREGIFRESVERRPPGPGGSNEYVFYYGPPFANGLPHYGHLVTGYVKEMVPRHRQAHRAPLPDDAGPARRTPLRLGLPRAPGRDAGREGARRLRPRADPGLRDRALPRPLPVVGHALHPRVAPLRDAPGALGRLRERLQDDGRLLHGERPVGVRAAVAEGARLRGGARAALLVGGRDAALELRDTPRRRGARAPGPGAHCAPQRRVAVAR